MLLFIAVIPLASGSLRPERESEFWKDSGLDLKLAAKLISTAQCMSGEQYYDSCRRAIYAGALMTGHAPQFQGVRSAKFPKKLEFDFLLTRVLQGATAAVPKEMLLGRMISAQLRVFDPYAQLIPSDYLKLILNGKSKTYYGFGFETEVSAAGLHLFNVFPSSPASAAGLAAGDRIVSVDGILAVGLYESKAVSDSLGAAKRGKTVQLEVERAGRVFLIQLKSAPITIDDIAESREEVNGKIYAIIRLAGFGQGICSALQDRLESLSVLGGKLAGVALDLRHNPGGLVPEGQCVAQLFMGKVPVVKRVPLENFFPAALDSPAPALPEYSNRLPWERDFKNFPLIVLIDAESKSMSEVVAGALQGYKRAWIVGERSFGKSTTQLSHPLPEYPKLRVLRTASRFQLPEAIARSEAGVAPDFEVPAVPGASRARRTFLRETEGKLPAPARQELTGRELMSCLSKKAEAGERAFTDGQKEFAIELMRCLSENET